jgi:hypothetical protein
VTDGAWQFTTLFGRRQAALSQSDGRWSIVFESGCCATGKSLDEAVGRAMHAEIQADRQRRLRPSHPA